MGLAYNLDTVALPSRFWNAFGIGVKPFASSGFVGRLDGIEIPPRSLLIIVNLILLFVIPPIPVTITLFVVLIVLF